MDGSVGQGEDVGELLAWKVAASKESVGSRPFLSGAWLLLPCGLVSGSDTVLCSQIANSYVD